MRKKLVINDLHIGVSRCGGASPQTALDLRLALVGKVRELMLAHTDKDIVINGDLFDAFDIPMADALAFYQIACEWLNASSIVLKGPDGMLSSPVDQPTLTLGRGNHDVSKDSSRLSMFDFIAEILANQWGDRVTVVKEPTLFDAGCYMIPHAVNQDIFNLQLAEAEKLAKPYFIFLHANFDNNFAVEQDHSLNVSRAQAQRLVDKGHTLIFGHEHQAKRAPGVRITGNQFPTSVADCLGNDNKVATVIDTDTRKIEMVETWKAEGSFVRIDWRDIGDGTQVEGEFIRVEGECSAEEASNMVSAVSKLRQKCKAYVVTNSVKVEGVAAVEDIKLAGEEMTGADVLSYLFEQLEPAQVEAVNKLLQESE